MTLNEMFAALDAAMNDAQQTAAEAEKVKAHGDAEMAAAKAAYEQVVSAVTSEVAAAAAKAAEAHENARTLQSEFAQRTTSLLDNVGRVRVS